RGEDLTVFGDGSQTRSFTFVDDLIEGIWKLSQTNYRQPINLGNPQEISILDFAKEIIELTGSDSKISYENLHKDDPHVRQPDISRAKKILNWTPKVEREEGLRKTISYFEKEIKK